MTPARFRVVAPLLSLALTATVARAGSDSHSHSHNDGELERRARAIDALPAAERVDARTRLAEIHWYERGELDAAAALLEAAVADDEGPRLARVNALEELIALDEARHAIDHASSVLERYPDLAPAATTRVRTVILKRRVSSACVVFLVALLAAGALATRKALQARGLRAVRAELFDPMTLALGLYVGLGVAALVLLHGEEARPFFVLGGGVIVCGAIARLFRMASPDASRAKLLMRAVACSAGVVALAFLAMQGFYEKG